MAKARLPRLKIKATVTEQTITLVLNKQVAVIKKGTHTDEYNQLKQMLKKRSGPREVENNFDYYLQLVNLATEEISKDTATNSTQTKAKSKKQDVVEMSGDYTGRVKLKNTDNFLPQDILKKLQQLDNRDQDEMLALLKFWYKLDKNPSSNSRDQLHRFVVKNNIVITKDGDIILEKGVSKKDGVLVDTHSKTLDNSIGRIVEMDRSKVQDDPNVSCSHGLHAAPPKYVRDHYSGTILRILVSPLDIVSVPKDYGSTKIRCCRYQVIGFTDKSNSGLDGGKVVDLASIIQGDIGLSKKQKKRTSKKVLSDTSKKNKEDFNVTEDFTKMTGRQIIEYVEKTYGEKITLNVKNKKGIVKKAIEIAGDANVKKHFDKKAKKRKPNKKEISLPTTNAGLIKIAKDKLNENISRVDGKKANKAQLQARFIELFTEAGYKLVE